MRAVDAAIAAVRLRAARPSVMVHDEGDGGPLLVVLPEAGFGAYLVEILRAEGIGSFSVVRAAELTDAALAAHDVVLLAAGPLPEPAIGRICRWVAAGGSIVAMRPDEPLASVFGLRPVQGEVVEGYLRVDTSQPAGAGTTDRPIRLHGPARRYELDGAEELASLLLGDRTPSGGPGVSIRRGSARGVAVAFAYDVARSIVCTRQGNPAWAGQNRCGDLVIRSGDLFYGAAPGDAQRDWVDRDLIDLPHADVQQGLLVALLHLATTDRPLARFWYLPSGHRAAIVMTGDDHGGNGTPTRFAEYAALDALDEGDHDWSRVRATSFVVPETPLSDAEAAELVRQGFEISAHVALEGDSFTPGSLHRDLRRQLEDFRRAFPSVPPPATHRAHCVPWSDWSSLPEVERLHGIRLDANYYYYPAPWVADEPGLFTGSGLPMRFATADGEVIDCYQAATQLTDESGQSYPGTIETLLDRALDPAGHVAVLTANMHTDLAGSNGADAIVAAARDRGVPVISARQLLAWLDARSQSSFGPVVRSGSSIHVEIRAHDQAQGLRALVPLSPPHTSVTAASCDGVAVPCHTEEHAGVTYAVVEARSGSYVLSCSDKRPPSRPAAGPPPRRSASAAVPVPAGLTPMAPFVHAGLADFTGGAFEGTSLSGADGGCIVLRPALALEPAAVDEHGLPTAWAVQGRAGAAAPPEVMVRAGWLEVQGCSIVGAAALSPGRSIEVSAVLAAGSGQRIGLVGDDGAVAAFCTGPGGELVVVAGRPPHLRHVAIPGSWARAAHRFGIQWAEGLVTFVVDRRPVVRHRLRLGDALRPLLDSPASDVRLQVGWVRVSPYAATGTYTSPVLDAAREVWWGRAAVEAVAASMTAARVQVRTGPAATPGGHWSSWVEPAPAGRAVGARARYAQYRLELSTCWQVSPEVRAVTLERFE